MSEFPASFERAAVGKKLIWVKVYGEISSGWYP